MIFIVDVLDFDGALYHITNSRDKPFTVSIKLKFFRDLEQHGTDEVSGDARLSFPSVTDSFMLGTST
jgi:hypothetical protein